jgi:hypothetical protein
MVTQPQMAVLPSGVAPDVPDKEIAGDKALEDQ